MQVALAEIAGEAGGGGVVVFEEGGVAVDVAAEAFAEDEFGVGDMERRVEGCAFGVLDDVIGPEGLGAVVDLDGFEGLFAWVEAKEMCWWGCQSWVRMTWSNFLARVLMTGTMASPSGTARLPPGMKSFWTSMTRRASVGWSCMVLMVVATGEECGRASHDNPPFSMRPIKDGPPDSVARLGFEVFGVLDGADFDVGLFAGFVAAEAGDPDFAVADHRALGVDEEGVVFLFEDGVLNVVGDDAVVVVDELFFVFDGEGFFAGVDLDGVVDEGGDGGGVVFGYGLLKCGEDLLDADVVADGEIDGFVVVGGGDGLG